MELSLECISHVNILEVEFNTLEIEFGDETIIYVGTLFYYRRTTGICKNNKNLNSKLQY